MMVNINQIQRGLEKYIECEFMNKAQGLAKWGIAVGGSIISNKAINAVRSLAISPELREAGFSDDTGNVDIEKIYTMIKPVAAKGPVVQEVPMLGNVTFSEADVDRLFTLICNS